MLQMPTNGNQVFEVKIYNREVRSLVKENLSHSIFDDHWADAHVHDICAQTEAEARSVMMRRFPSEDGFVIENISVTKL